MLAGVAPAVVAAAAAPVVVPAAGYPTDVVLRLHEEAYRSLTTNINDHSHSDLELAWAGTVEIGTCPDEDVLVYEVGSLQLLSAPEATATRCPVRPEELIDFLGTKGPLVFVHTHIVPEGPSDEPVSGRFLQCSMDDLRAFHRLPIGSLGVIVASRLPLQMRAWGWPVDGGDLAELSVALTTCCNDR